METKTSGEMRVLEWEYETKLLQDQIMLLPKHDPYRQVLQNDLEQRFNDRYGTAVPVRSGGANFNEATGVRADVVQRDGSGGYRLSQMPKEPKKEAGK